MIEQNIEVVNELDLMHRADILEFDLDRSYYRVFKYLQRYRYLRSKCFNEPSLKITTKYDFIYCGGSNPSSNRYTEVDRLLDLKREYDTKSEIIASLSNQLTQEEKIYFTYCLLEAKADLTATNEICCSNNGLIPIKKSCIIKVACALDLEVLKGDLMSDEEEDKYQEYLQIKGK